MHWTQISPFWNGAAHYSLCVIIDKVESCSYGGEGLAKAAWAKKWAELGKTVGLMLRICKPIFGIGEVVIFDSGFCVANGITELKDEGVYGGALIKSSNAGLKTCPVT